MRLFDAAEQGGGIGMFMVKRELYNIKNLFMVRLRTQMKNFIWLFIIAAVLIMGNLVPTVYGILANNSGFERFMAADLSVSFLLGMTVGFIITMFIYRQTNAKLSVFPQTNNSRFISSLIINYVTAAFASLTVLLMYLVSLGVIKLLSVSKDNVHFALTIDGGFIAAGFFVYLAYVFLVIAVIELAGTVLRKWHYYAAITFIALLSLIIINFIRVIEYAPKALAFIIGEPSLPLFFVKAAGVWLVITAASLIINRFTVYSKTLNKTVTKKAVIIGAALAVVLLLVVPAFILFNTTSESGFSMSETIIETVPDPVNPANAAALDEIRIDISHLPKGSGLTVSGENLAFMSESGSVSDYNYNNDAVVRGAYALNDLRGDTLVIQFSPAAYRVNGVEMLQYTNQRVTAYVDGDTLFMDYIRDSASVVFLPVWGIARQFDCFKDKGVLPAHSFGVSSGWWGSTNIYIGVE
jgi:hypothetical protein